jgi:hypothetical protein
LSLLSPLNIDPVYKNYFASSHSFIMVLEDGDSIAFSCHRGVIKEELSNAEISSSAIEATQKTLAEMDEKSPFFENNPGRELPVFRTKGKICKQQVKSRYMFSKSYIAVLVQSYNLV